MVLAITKCLFDFAIILAVLAGNDTSLTENITQDRKRFISQSKHTIF